MKIAQVSPLYESVPPALYGGTERVVSFLTEELVRLGHDVTLFASGDSRTGARLVPACSRSLRLDPECVDPVVCHFVMFEEVCRRAGEFDVVHFHTEYLHYPVARRFDTPQVTTLHGRQDLPEYVPLYREFNDVPLVSISRSQRTPLPQAFWAGTVHHGLPAELLTPRSSQDGYLAFLGRVSPEKGLLNAIEIALRVEMPLRIAAKIDKADEEYFHTTIEPLLGHPSIEFIGEIGEAQKAEHLGRARAVLFPISWPEPFGLVMIEAMATGTPVVAFRAGSVPEILEDGVTGFIVSTVEEAVNAVRRIDEIDRATCRRTFETRFSSERMARDYLALYDEVIDARRPEPRRELGSSTPAWNAP